jgi:glyoxylase-like metal-dependent hydrolase (beta-lactamase superfamily II)
MFISNYLPPLFGGGVNETAHEQVQRLGYRLDDVRHIAVTHMHLDHVGGLPDFPKAKVHIFSEEYRGISSPRTIEEKLICRREHWSHRPDWVIHELRGDRLFDFDCTPPFEMADIFFTFIPLTGHTRGHSAVAVCTSDSWLLHCGDAYVYHGDVDPDGPHYPSRYHLTLNLMGLFSKAFKVLGAHSGKLRRLLRRHASEVKLFCSHDPLEFSRYCPEYEIPFYSILS